MGKIEVYEDFKGLWRWRVRAGNGQIVASGHQPYKSRLVSDA